MSNDGFWHKAWQFALLFAVIALMAASIVVQGQSVSADEVRSIVAAEGGGGIRSRIEAYRRKNELAKDDLDFYLLAVPINLLEDGEELTRLIDGIRQCEKQCDNACAAIFIDNSNHHIIWKPHNQ